MTSYAGDRQRRAPTTSDAGVGAVAGATPALVAFLPAFVVGFGFNVMQERQQLVVSEAKAIGTTYLRAGYLTEPYRTGSRELWAIPEQVVAGDTSATIAKYDSSLNEVIDLHTERVAVGPQIRIPPTVLLTLYVIALAAMFLVGVQSGHADARNLVALVTLVLVLSAVLFLIVDLDRSQEGLLQVCQQVLLDLRSSLTTYS